LQGGRSRLGAGDVRKEMVSSGKGGGGRGGAGGKGGGSGPQDVRGRGGGAGPSAAAPAAPSAPAVAPPMSKAAIEKKIQQELEEYLDVGDASSLIEGLKELREEVIHSVNLLCVCLSIYIDR